MSYPKTFSRQAIVSCSQGTGSSLEFLEDALSSGKQTSFSWGIKLFLDRDDFLSVH